MFIEENVFHTVGVSFFVDVVHNSLNFCGKYIYFCGGMGGGLRGRRVVGGRVVDGAIRSAFTVGATEE